MLTNDEMPMFKCLHADFYADGGSVMDSTSGILFGRPFGGTGILWRKSIGDTSRRSRIFLGGALLCES